jgi:S-adenosylmethionine/arginine decarboxylase-like enzyme
VNQGNFRHLLNVYRCPGDYLARVEAVERRVELALSQQVLDTKNFFYQFTPQGVTGLSLWREGHFSIHTWPEREMAAVDVVGYPHNAKGLLGRLYDAFPAHYVQVQSSTKGVKKRTPRVGQEVIGSLYGVRNQRVLEGESGLLNLLKDISRSANFHVIGEVSRSDQEVIDAAVVLSESHFSVHYNKVRKEMKVDVFTCGKEGDPNKGYELLLQELGAQESERVYVKR